MLDAQCVRLMILDNLMRPFTGKKEQGLSLVQELSLVP